MRYFSKMMLMKFLLHNRESLDDVKFCRGNTVTLEFQCRNYSVWLEVQEGLFMTREERNHSTDQWLISKKKLRSAVLRLGGKYQRSGGDYVSHVLIQAHSDLSYYFKCGFQKTTTSKSNSFRLYLVLKSCQKPESRWFVRPSTKTTSDVALQNSNVCPCLWIWSRKWLKPARAT